MLRRGIYIPSRRIHVESTFVHNELEFEFECWYTPPTEDTWDDPGEPEELDGLEIYSITGKLEAFDADDLRECLPTERELDSLVREACRRFADGY